MDITYVIATLRYANFAFLTGKISRHDAKIAHDSAIANYHSCVNVSGKHKKWIEILSTNLIEAMNE